MTKTEILVEGEPAHLLIEAFQSIMANGQAQDGVVHFQCQLGGDSGAALIHSLGRVTAELHAADLRSFRPGGDRTMRTEGQRRHDALLVLIDRVYSALGLPPIAALASMSSS